ncbi:50S ribosomal protein L11 methyltransferase [Mucilaginibacter arboris]|uniref:Ribosomal protein L11 methyltransferase n=1 Tax=Mucilaginibacter arboris TaxID=2682090 RepID=A0A7K1SYG1_9SPHI|nr:50S ribosomal protein L11 methyltransferase [Mucilaginibacter arboris]MVN22343.1 50S ribosomal protein L11 methyltransferase [Mucilaginibacter arboris]
MNYIELLFTTIFQDEYQQDLLMNELAEAGCDTFEEVDFGFKAYLPAAFFNKEKLDERLETFHDMLTFSYEVNLIPQKNWNAVWESNFQPIQIKDQVWVRATFHEPRPDFPFEIVIDPKMAFGTGHHQTTSTMMDFMLDTVFTGKKVLDMGCGTGILAVLAAKKGATEIVAIDYDLVCYESTVENAALNHVKDMRILCGSKEAIPEEQFDIILANINRNILLDQMETYQRSLKPGGLLFLSGFYEDPDLDILKAKASQYQLRYLEHKKNQNWVAAKFIL